MNTRPLCGAELDELVGIGLGLKDAGRGVVQLISQFEDIDAEFAILREVARRSGRPISMSMSEDLSEVDWRDVLRHIESANAEGLEFRAQVAPRAIGAILGLTASLSPFSSRASFRALAELDHEEKCRKLADSEVRQRILSEPCDPEFARLDDLIEGGDWLWEMGEVPDYEPSQGRYVRRPRPT